MNKKFIAFILSLGVVGVALATFTMPTLQYFG